VLFALVLLAGITVELLQMYSNGRSPDIFDLMRNQVGCLVGFLFIYRWGRPGIHSRYFQVFQIIAVVLLLLVLWPFARSVSDELVAEKQFPLLSDFETPFETSRWKNPQQIKVQDLIVRHGRKSAKVFLSTARYSGVSLFYFPGNWESYRWLRFSVYNPDQDQLILHCRIHDVDHKKNDMEYKDRYGRKFRLTAGWNDLSVDLKEVAQSPATRSMDMRNIENLGLFVVQQKKPRILYIDHFYLEK
jgi:VanZ family protein